MQTRTLRTFLAVARAESFAQAAHEQNMTLSAVSMQMKALEEQLGAVLFDRAFRPPRLTPVGRRLTEQARAVVTAEDALWQTMRPRDPLAGDFRIGFINTASVRVLPAFLRRAGRERPQMRFQLRTGLTHELEADVRAGRLDFGVVTGPVEAGSDLGSLTLATEPLRFACNSAEATRDPAVLARATPFLQFRPEAGIGRLIARHIAPFLQQASQRPIVLDSVDAILECVKEGVGFTLLPAPDIARTADARVAAFWTGDGTGPGQEPTRELSLVYRPDQRQIAQSVAVLLGSDQGGGQDDAGG
ncbi:MAG: LysR family transcriptional regulator [Pseudomonadota bacterium]